MAASSSKCTAEEMEKAMADLDDLYARIPDECKFYCTEAEEEVLLYGLAKFQDKIKLDFSFKV